MNALKQLIIIPILALMLGSATLMAQMTDSLATSNNSSSNTTNALGNDGSSQKGSQYYWIGGVAFIVLVFGIGYMVRMKRKKNDDPHLSGDSINNPASGI